MEATSNSSSSTTELYGDGDNFTTEYPIYEENVFFFKTPEDMLNPSQRNPAFYPIVVTHAITFVLGIIGNIVAVSVMLGDRKGRSATNLFLVSLAVADLLLLLLCIPLEVLLYFLQFEDNGVICKTARYTELLSASASVLNLCAVSLERFIVIVFPMRSRSVCTMSNCRKAVCFVWVVAMVLSLPVMLTEEGYSVTYTNYITSVNIYYCEEKKVSEGLPIAIYKFVILFAAPALLMMICYFYVIRELWRSTRTINILTNTKSSAVSNKPNEGTGMNHCEVSGTSHKRNVILSGKGKKSVKGEERKLSSSPAKSGSQLQLQLNLIQALHNDRSPSICSLRSNGGCVFVPEESSHAREEEGNEGLQHSAEQELNVKYLQNHHHNNAKNGKGLKPPPTSNPAGRQNKAEDQKKTRKQVIKMLILIILLFLVCWGPKLILNITLKLALIFGLPIFRPEVYYCRVIFSLIPFVHSCINPIVYSFMSSTFRKKMSRQLGLCCVACGCKCKCIQVDSGTKLGFTSGNALPLRNAARAKATALSIETETRNQCMRPENSEVSIVRATQVEEVSAI